MKFQSHSKEHAKCNVCGHKFKTKKKVKKHKEQNKHTVFVSPALNYGFPLGASNAQSPQGTSIHPHKKIPENIARNSGTLLE